MSVYTFEGFTQRLHQELEKACRFSEAVVSLEQTEGKRRLEITLPLEEGSCGTFSFREEQLRASFAAGETVHELSGKILRQIDEVEVTEISRRVRNMNDYSAVRDTLFIRLLGTGNRRLAHAVYQKTGKDLALVLYTKLSQDPHSITSTVVPEGCFRQWGLDKQIVFKQAMEKTAGFYPPRLYELEKVFDSNPMSYRGEDFMTDGYRLPEGCRTLSGLCISTQYRINGASAVFYPQVAARLGELLEDDYYLVFTSIHEVMIHRSRETRPEMLKEVLADTIREATPAEDFLTYTIYRYDRERGIIETVPDDCTQTADRES